MRISPIEYKSQIRDSINNIFTIEFKIVRRIFPILIGVYKALYFKYQDNSILSTHEKIFLSCFQNNLPGIGPQHTKIAWQTFDQIFLDEFKTGSKEGQGEVGKTSPRIENLCGQGRVIAPDQTETLICKGLIQNSFNSSEPNFEADNLFNFAGSEKHGQTVVETNFYTKKLHFYNNLVTTSPSSNWDKKQKKLYLGLFNNKIPLGGRLYRPLAKQVRSFCEQPILVDKTNKNARRYQLGNNWSTITAKRPCNYHGNELIIKIGSIIY